jgi:O-acetylhomoserine/O-acetylserine sulfhydrylase-like pyridoxal-dependent enzyme
MASAESRLIHAGTSRTESLIRLSAGIEPAADLIADIDHSLEAAT